MWESFGCSVLIVETENCWGKGGEIREAPKLLL